MGKSENKRFGTGLFIFGIISLLGSLIIYIIQSGFTAAWVLAALGAICTFAGLWLNHSYRTKQNTFRGITYFLLAAGMLIMLFPFYWMISSAFKTAAEMSIFPPSWTPRNWLNFENFRLVFKTAPFEQYFINSVMVTSASVFATAATTILAAFAFSRLKFPGRELIFSLLLSMMMVPFEMLIITNYQSIIKVGLNDTRVALVIPFISSIFYMYILRNFFQTIPEGLYWSARVDGCTNWRYLWRVMVPIAKPSLVTIILLNGLASWNSFMWPLLIIKSDQNRTLPFGLYTFTTEVGANNELLLAASTIVVLPMVILFLLSRKQIVNGVARGGIKG